MKTIRVPRGRSLETPQDVDTKLRRIGEMMRRDVAGLLEARRAAQGVGQFIREQKATLQTISRKIKEADALSGCKVRPKWKTASKEWNFREFVLRYKELPSPSAHRPKVRPDVHRFRKVFETAKRRIDDGEPRDDVIHELARELYARRGANSEKAARKQLQRKFPAPYAGSKCPTAD